MGIMKRGEFLDFCSTIGLPVFLEEMNTKVDEEENCFSLHDFRMNLIKNNLYLDILINCADIDVANAALDKMKQLYKEYCINIIDIPLDPIQINMPDFNPNVQKYFPKERIEITCKDEAGKGTGNSPIGG